MIEVVCVVILFVMKANAAHLNKVVVFIAVVTGERTSLTTASTVSTSTIVLESLAVSTT